MDVDDSRPEIAKGAAYARGDSEGDDALQADDDRDGDNDAAVGGDVEDAVVEGEGGELGRHDGGDVGEFHDLAEFEPGLYGGDRDGVGVVAYAADFHHYCRGLH